MRDFNFRELRVLGTDRGEIVNNLGKTGQNMRREAWFSVERP
jgi:hypothetical protein